MSTDQRDLAAMHQIRAPMMKRPRRIVQKALDGEAQIRAYLLQQTTCEGYANLVRTVRFLLENDVCPSDVNKMTGFPLLAARNLGGEEWKGVRMGRVPGNIGRVFQYPLGHLRVSVFLGFLERVTRVTCAEGIKGESFAAALRATQDTCGSAGAEHVTSRYLMLAVMEVSGGTCWLHTCPTCRVRFLRSRVLQRVQSGVFSHGECPLCRHVKQVRAKRANEQAFASRTLREGVSVLAPTAALIDD